MAITVAELIEKKQSIQAKNKTRYVLDTSVGEIVAKLPTLSTVSDAWDMNTMEANKYLILNCVIEPDLRNKQLLDAYGCVEPTDIISAIFQVGEISRIATALMKLAGFEGNITSRIHREVKN